MNVILLGAAGFIGTNLVIQLSRSIDDTITIVDRDKRYFKPIESLGLSRVKTIISDLSSDTNYEELVSGQDVVYHLISTTVPSTSNQYIAEELKANVILSANLLEACVKQSVKKIIFISSGGTVYGKESRCPLDENTPTNPITSYGIQKITIEKLLYLYNYLYGLDYRIIRLSNPYGPYQRPNGIIGAVTTFTYKALRGEEIIVYGDGSVIRDFIYIDDAIRGIKNIVEENACYHTFNLGCGYGTSIKQVIETIRLSLGIDVNVKYTESRSVDVPVNYLDINRFETTYGKLNPISLDEGIRKTADFMRSFYGI
jgi:UDP-glucose 4-epimerase